MTLREQIENDIPEHLIHMVPNRFEVIGDVVVISIPKQLDLYKAKIADMIITRRKNVKTVLNKTAMIGGEKRLGKFEILSGGNTCTIHREFGFRYFLDVTKVFFTTRLVYERFRIASMVQTHEHILIPFCGAGPFVIPAAGRGAEVTAVDMNADACRYLQYNARLNRLESSISIIRGDAANLPEMIDHRFSRVVLPLPYGKDHYIEKISSLVEKGGKMHIYTFKKYYQIEYLEKMYNDLGFRVIFRRKCGNIAPGVSRWVFDLIRQ